MRKIKFRGKDIKGNWRYGDLITIEHFVANSKEKYQIGDFESSLIYDIGKETIGQFTGLHDKNGKEIYEGDIVLIEVFNYQEPEWSGEFEVIYSQDLASYIFDDLEDISNFKTINTIKDYYHYEIEVIGNIYENKELLNT